MRTSKPRVGFKPDNEIADKREVQRRSCIHTRSLSSRPLESPLRLAVVTSWSIGDAPLSNQTRTAHT